MNKYLKFKERWQEADNDSEDLSIFVKQGDNPKNQRQFNLYHYFEFIKRIVLKNSFKKVLEVGCGRGTISLYLNKYLNASVDLVDEKEEAIKLARKNFFQHDALGNFSCQNAEKLNYSNNSFDLVTSIGLAEHFENYNDLFKEQFRVLKPGGMMISLNIPQKFSIQILNTIYRFLIKLLKRNNNLRNDYYRNKDKPSDYIKAARKAGFTEVNSFYVNPFPLFTPLNKKIERVLVLFYRFAYAIRGLFMKYPFKGSGIFSQAHFLIAKKPDKTTKTIFITITRGVLARNFLRTDFLKKILEEDIKVVILVPGKIHKYFREEFKHEKIVFEEVKNVRYTKLRMLFVILFNGLVYTETEHRKIKFGGGNKQPETKFIFWSKHLIFSVLSRIRFIKYIVRYVEQNIFQEKYYDYLFEKYDPSLIFCSSLYSKLDSIMIKAARRFDVVSISTPKSWDTVGRLFFRNISDKIIFSNGFMKEWAVKNQLVKKENIFICGIPQFDVYVNKKDYLTKGEFCEKTNLDPQKPIVLFASEGIWTHWDEVYVDDLIKNCNILDKYNLILRPHFANACDKIYHRFKEYKNIYIDDENIRITKMFGDNWDPTKENMEWLAEVLNATDIVVTFMTTFTLDAFAYKKPVINIFYDLPVEKPRNDWPVIPMKELYNCAHYNAVTEEDSTVLAKNGKEVMDFIGKFLRDPDILQDEREKTVKKLCYKVDGRSAERMAQIIIDNLR